MTQNRERGTLQSTLPDSPVTTLSLFVFFCTAVATFISHYSTREDATQILANTIFKASIGALSTTMGILFVDPIVYGASFSIAVSRYYLMTNETEILFCFFFLTVITMMMYSF